MKLAPRWRHSPGDMETKEEPSQRGARKTAYVALHHRDSAGRTENLTITPGNPLQGEKVSNVA